MPPSRRCCSSARDDNWQLGAVAVIGANLCLGASTVFNDAILPLISDEDERDRVSSRGWAFGYLGGGLLLAVNLAVVTFTSSISASTEDDRRLAAGSACCPPRCGGRRSRSSRSCGSSNHPPQHVVPESGGLIQQSFGQLWATLRDLRNYPVALTFLLAYLFFNDGIQTVIASASVYGEEELGFEHDDRCIVTILLVQFVGVLRRAALRPSWPSGTAPSGRSWSAWWSGW